LAERTVYKDLEKGDIIKYGIDIQNAGGQYTKMLQVCSGSMKVNETSTLKLKTSKDDALADVLNGTEKPVVVFCTYRASVDRAAGVARKAGRTVVIYDGRSAKDAWKRFQSGECDCIVCQYQSGGAGLNLQNSSVMVLFEPCYSALLLAQAKGRIFRSGQHERCVYYYLVTPDTLERRVWNTVRSGQDVSEELMSEWGRMSLLEAPRWQYPRAEGTSSSGRT
jgi:SNF2 family DNA or RNA helicase